MSKDIERCMSWPLTSTLTLYDPALYTFTYKCNDNKCNISDAFIQPENELYIARVSKDIERVCQDIDKNSDRHLPDKFDGFLFVRNNFPLIMMKRSPNSSHCNGRTAVIDLNCLMKE